MMAMELADPVETTKLLVFMCVDSPSPWPRWSCRGLGSAMDLALMFEPT